MSRTIDKELSKVKVADLSHYDSATNTYVIPRFVAIKFEIGASYLIELDDSLLQTSNNIIATNWNRGSVPTSKYYKIEVIKSVGKMLYIDGLAYDIITKTDLNITWSGWLPIEQIKLIENLSVIKEN
jgi:hypothetical protein